MILIPFCNRYWKALGNVTYSEKAECTKHKRRCSGCGSRGDYWTLESLKRKHSS